MGIPTEYLNIDDSLYDFVFIFSSSNITCSNSSSIVLKLFSMVPLETLHVLGVMISISLLYAQREKAKKWKKIVTHTHTLCAIIICAYHGDAYVRVIKCKIVIKNSQVQVKKEKRAQYNIKL